MPGLNDVDVKRAEASTTLAGANEFRREDSEDAWSACQLSPLNAAGDYAPSSQDSSLERGCKKDWRLAAFNASVSTLLDPLDEEDWKDELISRTGSAEVDGDAAPSYSPLLPKEPSQRPQLAQTFTPNSARTWDHPLVTARSSQHEWGVVFQASPPYPPSGLGLWFFLTTVVSFCDVHVMSLVCDRRGVSVSAAG